MLNTFLKILETKVKNRVKGSIEISVMEQLYKKRWDENIMVDSCWTLKRDLPQKRSSKRRMPLRRFFECERVPYNEK